MKFSEYVINCQISKGAELLQPV